MTCWPILLYGTSSFQWYRSEDTCIIHAVKDQDVYHMRHASWIHALRKYGYMHYECMHYKYLRHGQKHYGCMHHGYLQAAPWIHAYCIMDTRSKDTSAWVMRLERPKGVKDGVKLAGRAQSRPWSRFGGSELWWVRAGGLEVYLHIYFPQSLSDTFSLKKS